MQTKYSTKPGCDYKICNLVVIHKLTYQKTSLTYHFLTVEPKCCLSKSSLLNKKLLQSLLCKAKWTYLLKIETIYIADERSKIS